MARERSERATRWWPRGRRGQKACHLCCSASAWNRPRLPLSAGPVPPPKSAVTLSGSGGPRGFEKHVRVLGVGCGRGTEAFGCLRRYRPESFLRPPNPAPLQKVRGNRIRPPEASCPRSWGGRPGPVSREATCPALAGDANGFPETQPTAGESGRPGHRGPCPFTVATPAFLPRRGGGRTSERGGGAAETTTGCNAACTRRCMRTERQQQ